MMESKASVTAFGAYAPEKILTNDELSRIVDTNDEWITQRSGIKTRRVSAADEFPSHQAVKAVRNLVELSGKQVDDVDYIIVATVTSDYRTPSCAALVQKALDLPQTVGVLDINAACAGFVQGLLLANSFITSNLARKVLVIASEVLTKITDYQDRNTCVLFGDGAGAALVERNETEPGFLAFNYGSDGGGAEKLFCSGMSTRMNGAELCTKNFLWQDGRAVYSFAIKAVPQGVRLLAERAGISIDEIDWFVPHSANLRMIRFIAGGLKIPDEKTLTSVEEYGNTSAASIPLAIWLAWKEKKIKRGDIMALYGFGGGFNHAGVILRL